jgi:2,4-dienoyl-CoA reductase-like NADH-dependent reductase (Old Yellow Enzyme family)/thioredoxin reductase
MPKRFEMLSSKCRIGNLELKNRIVLPPLNNNYTRAGFMTEESIDFYVSRARGGAGLIIIEATSVDYPRSRSVLNPAIDDDKFLPAFVKIAEGCHAYNSKVFVQLSHVGRQTRKSVTGMDPVAPSPIASKSALYPDTPHVLSVEDIEEIIGKFGDAALRAQKAGLDGVELILGHGYLANNFLTPASNLRTDEYGGLQGGLRFSIEIVRKIKQLCGEDFPIICRINGDDYIKENGNTPVEAQLLAQELQKAGVDAISVSAGMRDSELSFNDHSSGQPRGAWIHLAERIKKVVDIPVIAVKRFSPELAEETLQAGKADLIAFGKQLIADPDFPNKVLAGRLADVIPCTSCCQGCYDELWMKKPVTCMVNPAVGKSVQYKQERSKRKGNKKVLVIGGGPAGCEVALEAAKIGHQVTLIEKDEKLGGNYGYCAYTSKKKEVADVFTYLDHALRQHNVQIRTNTEFAPGLLDELKPEVVIDATGADFKMPSIKGANLPHVVTPLEALDGSKELGQYVTIVSCSYNCTWTCRQISNPIPDDVVGLKITESYACSAGHAAADVAEELAARGKKVTIITGRDAFVPGMGYTNRGNMFKRFFPAEIKVSNSVKVKEIRPEHLLCEKEGIEFLVYADTVVLSVGMESRNTIEEQLQGYDVEFYRVGDCAKIGNALKAFDSAYQLAEEI